MPFQRPTFPPTEAIERYFALSREAALYSNGGPCHQLLVARLRDALGGRSVVPVSSGGIGLIVALRALARTDGRRRQVLLPSFTFAATAAAVVWCGLEPVFCDIEPDGWHLCPARLGEALADREGDVAAVLACSAFGTPPANEITAGWSNAAASAGVPLIIDSASGLGAGPGATPAPDAEIFSMHATKPLPIGEGGLVALRDDGAAERIGVLINHGLAPDRTAVMVGLNGKLDEWHCAAALAGLDRLDELLTARRAVAAALRRAVQDCGVRFQRLAERSPSQFVPVLMPTPDRREAVLDAARVHGVQLRTYYSPPLHVMPAYAGCAQAHRLDVTLDVAQRIVSLPAAEDLSASEVTQIARCFET